MTANIAGATTAISSLVATMTATAAVGTFAAAGVSSPTRESRA